MSLLPTCLVTSNIDASSRLSTERTGAYTALVASTRLGTRVDRGGDETRVTTERKRNADEAGEGKIEKAAANVDKRRHARCDVRRSSNQGAT
jgi:hypothetical protein